YLAVWGLILYWPVVVRWRGILVGTFDGAEPPRVRDGPRGRARRDVRRGRAAGREGVSDRMPVSELGRRSWRALRAVPRTAARTELHRRPQCRIRLSVGRWQV